MGIVRDLLTLRLRVDYSESFGGAVAVVAVPFNRYLRGQTPDATNKKIAAIAAKYVSLFHLPFIGQWEQSNLLRDAQTLEYHLGGRGEWVQTRELLRWVAEQVLRFGRGGKVILVGHPHHIRRFWAIARYFGLEPLVVRDCETVPYDHDRKRPGVQIWTTSPWLYLPWEYVSRIATVLLALAGRL